MSPSKIVPGFLFVLTAMLGLPAQAQDAPVLFAKALSPRTANYDIHVKLDAEKKMLAGEEVLIWHNQSKDSIKELQFHLYLNGFRNSKSTLMRGSHGLRRAASFKKKNWGYSEVKSFKVIYGRDIKAGPVQFPSDDTEAIFAEAHDLTEKMRFIQPDDGNEDDKTVFTVPLPEPLQPGELVAVEVHFAAKLPEPPFERTGAWKEFFFMGQWFPKIGVYTKDGWNTHQFHPQSEFFADFGVYNVWMTVPDDHVLGATGVQVAIEKNDDGTATHFYHAEDVHDFAWTSSPEFREFTGKEQDVDIRILLQPDHVNQAERHMAATKRAIEFFQNNYGDYPFPNLTVVDPRRGASAAGGMEYPTLVTSMTNYAMPDGIGMVEEVITHEFGHNYWYHLLASNEFEESWLDEGINTYTDLVFAQKTDFYIVNLLGVKIDHVTYHRMPLISAGYRDPIMRRSWEYYSDGSFGVNSYSKTGLVLLTLRNYLGEVVMNRIMRTYVERWRFKHPQSQDFFDIVNEVSGQNLDRFIQQAFYTKASLDYTVSSVFTRPVRQPKGFDFTESVVAEDTTVIAGEKAGAEVKDVPVEDSLTIAAGVHDSLEVADSTAVKEKKMYYSGVNIRRLQAFVFPVEIEVVFDDGKIIHEQWDGKELWKKFRYTRPAKLVSATVDPERKILIDINFTNNSKTVKQQKLGVNKLSARLMFWFQFVLDQPDFLNLVSVPMSALK